MSYRIEASAEKQVIYCLKCGGSSENPRDVKLRNCPNCGYHCVFPPGMMSETLGVGLGSLARTGTHEAVPDEDEESDQ